MLRSCAQADVLVDVVNVGLGTRKHPRQHVAQVTDRLAAIDAAAVTSVGVAEHEACQHNYRRFGGAPCGRADAFASAAFCAMSRAYTA